MILKGRVAIITGAGSGIGKAGAAIMAHEGAHVIIIDKAADKAETAAARINQSGGDAEAIALDVTDDSELEAAILT